MSRKENQAEEMYKMIKYYVDEDRQPLLDDYLVYKTDDLDIIVENVKTKESEKFNILSEAIIYIVDTVNKKTSIFKKIKRRLIGIFTLDEDKTCDLYDLKDYAKTLHISERFSKTMELHKKNNGMM